MYQIELRHDGLGAYRLIRGRDRYIVEQKASAQTIQWARQWDRRQALLAKRADRERKLEYQAEQERTAEQANEEAQAAISAVEGLLQATLSRHDAVDWNALKDTRPFPTQIPGVSPPPTPPVPPLLPQEPQRSDTRYRVSSGLLDALLPGRFERRAREAEDRYRSEHQAWRAMCEALQARFQHEHAAHLEEYAAWRQQSASVLGRWERARQKFLAEQLERNAAIDRQCEAYRAKSPEAIEDYFELVLSRSEYPDTFPKLFEVVYVSESQTLYVNYVLPTLNDMPNVKEVRYVKSRDALQETPLSERARGRLYEVALYQVALRTMHELFEADEVTALVCVCFNGHVQAIDPATGRLASRCVLSVSASRASFMEINLANVDPEACFIGLGGKPGRGLLKLESIEPRVPLASVVEVSPEPIIPIVAPSQTVEIDLSSLDE